MTPRFKTYHSKNCRCNDCLIGYPEDTAPPSKKTAPAPAKPTINDCLTVFIAQGREFTVFDVENFWPDIATRPAINRAIRWYIDAHKLDLVRLGQHGCFIVKAASAEVIHDPTLS